ncbi:Similar to ORF1: Nucleic-acid-binding protein from transposon X-element (Drosophila melanogaster), partial [Cotesia congregata]
MTYTHSQQNTQEFQQAGTSSQTIDPENLKTFRPLLIFVTGEKVSDSIKTLKNAGLPQDSFSVSISKVLHSIQVMKQIDYDKVKLALKSNQIQFYSFTPKGEKLKSILLKGVSEEYTTEQALEDLLSRNIPSVEIKKVTELKFVHDNQERRHLIVSSLKELFKIKNVLHMKTRWERLRRNKLLQCRRCQRIGHTAANCEMLFRCVKCGETHEPGKCLLNTATSRENFKCANYGKPGHPANYTGCKYIKFAHLSKKAELQSRNKSLAKKIDQVTGNYFPPRQFSNTAAQQKDAFPPLPSRNQANGIIQRSQPSPWQTSPPIGENAQPDWLAQIKNEICSLTNHYLLSNTYSIIRTDRPLQTRIIRYPSSNKNELLEFTIVQLLTETSPTTNIFIISCYTTNSNKRIFIHELNDLLQRLDLNNPNNSFILAGDLNARRIEWSDSDDNQRGKFLRNWEKDTLAKYRAKIYSTEEASFTPAKTFLDVCITDLIITNLTSNGKINTADYDSDHRALLFTIVLPSHTQQDHIPKPCRNIRAIKWKKFEKIANTNYTQDIPADRNLSIPEIDSNITVLTSTL